MSRFLKALELAEQERTLREHRHEAGPVLGTAAVAPAAEEFAAPAPRQAITPDATGKVNPHLVSLLTPASFEAEQYRTLRHVVEQLHRTSQLSVIAVSSPTVGDGKTTTVLNLAGALAQAPDARVLVVDADLRRPSLARQLGLVEDHHPGLVDAIVDPTLSLSPIVRERAPFNLSVVPAGRRASAPYEVLKSSRLGELLEDARCSYDFVILDTPPLVGVPDCRVIGKWVDGFLVVLTAHKTPRELLDDALGVVEAAKIVGLVFNGDDHSSSTYDSAAYGQLRKVEGKLRRRLKKSE